MRNSAPCGRSSIAFSVAPTPVRLTLRVVVDVGKGLGQSMGLNTAILAGATTAAQRAGCYAQNNPWVGCSGGV